jgi:DivIVA domain-containing protein
LSLDRESIERKNFPLEKRGYDPAAVDAHLSALADEVEQLKRGSDQPHTTLASAVSEQVRGIVEAAENSAEEILRSAELEAEEIRAQASRATERAAGEAQKVRERATAQAREYVEGLSSSISALLGRLETIHGELHSLTTPLRDETERLRGELAAFEDELEGEMGATGVSAPAPQVEAFEPARAAADVSEPMPAPLAVPEPTARADLSEPVVGRSESAADLSEPAEYSSHSVKVGDTPIAEPPAAAGASETDAAAAPPAAAAASETAVPAAAPSSGAPASGDTEGARLIALNMALNGTPREETERYLAENYDLADRQRLLDEVYASVQG